MKYPMIHPYKQFQRLLETHEELSLRKQFCYAFIRWGYTLEIEAKIEFVELAKRFRKGRVAEHRTLLERKARKLYRSVRGHVNREASRQAAREWGYKTKAEGIGVHSPEYKAKLTEHNRKIRKLQTEKNMEAFSKNWIVRSPDNQVLYIRNLKRFCRENGLNYTPLRMTNDNPGSTYKGWQVEKVSEDWKQLQES